MKLTKEVLEEVGRQHHWLQPLEFTFRGDADGIRALAVVNRMARNVEGQMLVATILGSSDWGGDRNRKQTFWMPRLFDWTDTSFSGIVQFGVESIHVVGTSPLHAAVTGKQRRRDEAALDIVEGVFPRDFRDEIVRDWGVNVSASFDPNRPLPVLHVFIEQGGRPAVHAEILCWSGIIRIANREIFCDSFDVARKEIEDAFNTWLEVETANA